jgi:gamma-butyrobetaine hydroxylase
MPIAVAEIIEDGRAVALSWADGRQARFHALWLRDNAPDAATRAPGNGQRLISVLDLQPALRVAAAAPTEDGVAITFAPERLRVVFAAAWLAANAYDRPEERRIGWTGAQITRWAAATLPRLPSAPLAALRADRAALGAWLGAVRRLGVAHVSGLPRASGAVCEVAALFGHVRETNYGRHFDVRAEVNPNNLAYTSLGLQAHTDNPYRDPVPTLQILACLENTVTGGDTIVVDGFSAIGELRPDELAALARYPARFVYGGMRGVRLSAKRPMIELGPDGELLALRFNNRSAAALTDVPYDAMPGYYAAHRRLAELIASPALALSFRLAPGEAFIVDNTRVLHGRTAFSASGHRWLQGCYADKDGLLSTLAAIEEEGDGRHR